MAQKRSIRAGSALPADENDTIEHIRALETENFNLRRVLLKISQNTVNIPEVWEELRSLAQMSVDREAITPIIVTE